MTKQDIAKAFYDLTGYKATKTMFFATMAQAQALLDAGYTKQEIIECIKYCIENPPRNGFQSLAWVQYDINKIVIKLKAQTIKNDLTRLTLPEISQIIVNGKKQSEQERVGSEFDFKSFDKED